MTIRIIQVGMGGWGKDWARRMVPQVEAVEPVAWVDMDAATLEAARTQLSLPAERCFVSLEEALTKVECEAVLVTASLPGHVPNAVLALHAGKHVLMEKPFAPSLAEAQGLVELAERQGLTLMISQNYRFTPAARMAAQVVRERLLGRVGYVGVDFRQWANSGPANGRHFVMPHALLQDMSIHHFDLMRFILGEEPVEVSCTGHNPPWSQFHDIPAATAMITFASGAQVSYRGSWISTGPSTNWAGDWSIDCEDGEIAWTSRGEPSEYVALRLIGKPHQQLDLPTIPYMDRAGTLNAFATALASGTEPECSGRDNLKTLALLFATIQSAETGQRVIL